MFSRRAQWNAPTNRLTLARRAYAGELLDLTVPSTKGGLVKLSSVATLREARGPSEIEHLDRERIVTVLGNPDQISLNEAVQRSNAILDELRTAVQ